MRSERWHVSSYHFKSAATVICQVLDLLLADSRVDPNAQTNDGATALYAACQVCEGETIHEFVCVLLVGHVYCDELGCIVCFCLEKNTRKINVHLYISGYICLSLSIPLIALPLLLILSLSFSNLFFQFIIGGSL